MLKTRVETVIPNLNSKNHLEHLLKQWLERLKGWAEDGSMSRAAQDALRLDSEPAVLTKLLQQWSAGDFRALPPIEVLPGTSMPTAAGAYAISTGKIYLNAKWLLSATQEQVCAVLTEELGHHLDGLLNFSDTPGDEGELFADLLGRSAVIDPHQRDRILAETDLGTVLLNGDRLIVEQASVVSTTIPVANPGHTRGEYRHNRAFAALRADGSVVTWGDPYFGGNSSGVAGQLRSGVTQIFSNNSAFAALKADGSVVTWGFSSSGGDSTGVAGQLRSGVTQIFSTRSTFAALKADGSVVTWGYSSTGGDSSGVAGQLRSGVTQIFSNNSAFAALKADGSVVTWGDSLGGDSSEVAGQLRSGVTQIFPTEFAFAALKADGSVVTWGESFYGGDISRVAGQLRSGVTQIFSTSGAFAALKADGSVVTWADSPSSGGDSSGVAGQLRSGVTQISSTHAAFAALKADGSVVTWGNSSEGGDSTGVAGQLRSGVTQIFSNYSAFAALKADGSVVTWGNSSLGGDSTGVAGQLRSGVTQIFSTESAFAALKADGSVVTWGPYYSGGVSTGVAEQLRSGVTQIFSSNSAFAALKADGSVVTWGNSDLGGDSTGVAGQLTDVVAFANPFTDDRLVIDTLPSITVAVSPVSATEDETGNLVYSFTRTGSTTNTLLINYTVDGTATLGTDYTGVPATPATKTVGFAAGSSTATVTVDPATDTVRESNEFVTLTVVPGFGYTVGSASTATGTIIDDDRDFRLSTVSGLSLLQDDSTGLIRLKRANSSSVPVTWGNNTPLTAATFPGWQLLAAAQLDGADSLLWRYLPTGQLHTWTLDQSGRQTSGSPLYSLLSPELPLLEQKFGVDLDADGHLGSPNVIVSLTAESRAGTAFFPQSDSLLYREAATDRLFVQLLPRFTNEYHYPTGLLWGGTPILAVDSRLPGWSAVAASSIDGVNTLLWRNQGAGLLATWAFDDHWNAVSGTAPVFANSTSAFALEKAFKSDLNGGGVVGAPFVVLAADGATSLVRLTSNRRLAVQSSNGLVHSLLWGGSAITEADPRLPGWSAVSAGVVNGVNTVVWRNSSASLLATWSFDSQWRATGGTSPVPFSSPQVWDYETWSKKDLNNDHVIGAPPSGVVSTVGDLWLQRLGPNLNLYAFKPGSPTFSLRWGGSQLSTTDPRLSGWSPVAAATINGVNSLLWRYDATGQLTTWAFDGSWNAISGTPPVQAMSQAAHDLEVSFQADANRDGVIGSPHQVISSIGSIDLLKDSDGLLLISRNGLPPISMAWGGAALTVNDPRLTGWTAIAATDRSGSNSLLWRHTTGQLATWTFDANWNALSGTAPVRSDSQAALAIEADFIRDLNGDGAIGEPTSPIERLRYRLQQVAPSSNSREPFSAVFSGGSSADVIVNPLTGNVQSNVLMSGSDFITGLPLQAGAIDLLDGGTGPGRNTFLLSTITNQPFADDGDSGYVLIRNYDTLNDDLVVASDLPLSTSVRSVAFDGITVTGIGLHVDKNRNGLYDSGDNLIGLLDGITTVPSRLIRLPAG